MIYSERSRRLASLAVVVLTVGSLAGLAAGTALQFQANKTRTLGFAGQSAVHLADVAAAYIDRVVESADQDLAGVVLALEEASAAADAPAGAGLSAGPIDEVRLAVFDARGAVRFQSSPRTPVAPGTGGPVSALSCVLSDGRSWLAFSRRLQSGGLAVAQIAVAQFDVVLGGDGEPSRAALYDADGRVCGTGAGAPVPGRLDSGGRDMPVLRPLAAGGMTVAAFVETEAALAGWRADLHAMLSLAGAFAAVLLAAALVLIRLINRNFAIHHSEVGEISDYSRELELIVDERTQALREARAAAEKASEAKSRFLAAAAHDLRQPLQAMMMFVDELGYRPLNNEDQALVRRIEASSLSLSRLLNGLLDIGAIDSGMTVPRLGDVAIARLLEDALDRFAGPAEAKGLDLLVVPCRASVRTDPVLTARILSNLVSNAVRYTEQGRILVGCRRRGAHLLLQVIDTGIGIPADQLPLIFEEYYQVDNPGRDRRRGSGLGLAIVDRLARLLEHRVEVRSTPGRGSVFSVWLPLVDAPPAEEPSGEDEARPAAATEVRTGGLVALVEDDPEVRRAVETSLRNRGYAVLPAATLGEAMNLVRWAGRPPMAVIADYRLADGQVGTAVIAAIRGMFPDAAVGAILLTGEQKLETEPPADVLVLRKPVAPSVLCASLSALPRG